MNLCYLVKVVEVVVCAIKVCLSVVAFLNIQCVTPFSQH